jgi:hypothetical protein
MTCAISIRKEHRQQGPDPTANTDIHQDSACEIRSGESQSGHNNRRRKPEEHEARRVPAACSCATESCVLCASAFPPCCKGPMLRPGDVYSDALCDATVLHRVPCAPRRAATAVFGAPQALFALFIYGCGRSS